MSKEKNMEIFKKKHFIMFILEIVYYCLILHKTILTFFFHNIETELKEILKWKLICYLGFRQLGSFLSYSLVIYLRWQKVKPEQFSKHHTFYLAAKPIFNLRLR